jgi:hypothetical protein
MTTTGALAPVFFCAIVLGMDIISLDLPDFIPESYELPLTVNSHSYHFKWAEAQVDEVLAMILNPKDQDPIKNQRITVTQFLQAHITEGDKEQLAKDLELVPYQSKRGSLSILQLMEAINGRVKKNEAGDSQEKVTTGLSGSQDTSHS